MGRPRMTGRVEMAKVTIGALVKGVGGFRHYPVYVDGVADGLIRLDRTDDGAFWITRCSRAPSRAFRSLRAARAYVLATA